MSNFWFKRQGEALENFLEMIFRVCLWSLEADFGWFAVIRQQEALENLEKERGYVYYRDYF